MLKIALTASALALAATAFPASAEGQFYVGGFVGGGFPGDASLTGTQQPEAGAPGVAGDPARIGAEYDSDINYGFVVGYDLPWEFFGIFTPRMELEYSTIDADVDTGSFNSGNQSFGGDTSIDFFLINNYTDVIWQDGQTLIPYFGGGIGVAKVDANILYAGGGATAPNFAITGDDTGLAGTFAGGLTLRTGSNWEVYGEARYYQIRNLDFERRFIGGGANLFSADVADKFDGTTLTAGLRYRF